MGQPADEASASPDSTIPVSSLPKLFTITFTESEAKLVNLLIAAGMVQMMRGQASDLFLLLAIIASNKMTEAERKEFCCKINILPLT